MSQALVGKKFGIEQTEVSAIQRLQRAKTARLIDEHEKKVRRSPDRLQLVLLILNFVLHVSSVCTALILH